MIQNRQSRETLSWTDQGDQLDQVKDVRNRGCMVLSYPYAPADHLKGNNILGLIRKVNSMHSRNLKLSILSRFCILYKGNSLF